MKGVSHYIITLLLWFDKYNPKKDKLQENKKGGGREKPGTMGNFRAYWAKTNTH